MAPGDSEGLYPPLLGAGWNRLDERLRGLFYGRGVRRVQGTFDVGRGVRLCARLLAALLRLPKAGARVDTRVSITPLPGGGELWTRRFGADELTTRQRAEGARLVERAGPLELSFTLRASDGALEFRPEGCALALGGWRVALPRCLAPRVDARAWVTPGAPGARVRVELEVPLVGRLLAYEGGVESGEAPS